MYFFTLLWNVIVLVSIMLLFGMAFFAITIMQGSGEWYEIIVPTAPFVVVMVDKLLRVG